MKLIDLGAFNGDSALHFISYPDIDAIDAYEPNSNFADIWSAIHKHYPTINFWPKAVYTHAGVIEFSKRPDDLPLGSSVMPAKEGFTDGQLIQVPCLDILDIIPDEPFCLKVDVEGAEYDILERLIEAGKDGFIDRLYVEWHDTKMSSDNSQRQVAIEQHFGDRLKRWL